MLTSWNGRLAGHCLYRLRQPWQCSRFTGFSCSSLFRSLAFPPGESPCGVRHHRLAKRSRHRSRGSPCWVSGRTWGPSSRSVWLKFARVSRTHNLARAVIPQTFTHRSIVSASGYDFSGRRARYFKRSISVRMGYLTEHCSNALLAFGQLLRRAGRRPQRTAFFTSAVILASSVAVNSLSAY